MQTRPPTWQAAARAVYQRTALPFCGLFQLSDELVRIEADRVCEVEKLDDIQPPLPALQVGDERLVAPKRTCHVGLVEPGFLAVLEPYCGPKPAAGAANCGRKHDSDALRRAIGRENSPGESRLVDDNTTEDSPIPAGFTFLGQFIDHDVSNTSFPCSTRVGTSCKT